MIRYEIYRKNKRIKVYPLKFQASIYCLLKGYVKTGRYSGKRFYFLDPDIEIKKKVYKIWQSTGK